MGRQIHFFLCKRMRKSIESEARRIGATLVNNYSNDTTAVQFSTHGDDKREGRLWAHSFGASSYEKLRSAVKKGSVYDRDARLWVKRDSRGEFDTYWQNKSKALADLVARNQKYAVEVLAARIVKRNRHG